MRFKDIILTEIDLNLGEDTSGNFVVLPTDELIDVVNGLRKTIGCTDLVEVGKNNDVYYTFYLSYSAEKEEINLQAVCSYGEKDDYACYNITLSLEEKTMLMFRVIKALTIEVWNA